MLGLDEAATDLDGVQFIPADAAVEQFLTARFRIEKPLPALLDERHGERPAVIAYLQKCAATTLRTKRNVLFHTSQRGKFCSHLAVASRFARVVHA